MSDEIKARIPFGPEHPWHEFVNVYENLPLRKSPMGPYKEIRAYSRLIEAGLLISSTFNETEEIGRVSFPRIDADQIPQELRTTFESWGWKLLTQGTDRMVFRKTLPIDNGTSSMPMALLNVLPILGVEPKQDWVVSGA